MSDAKNNAGAYISQLDEPTDTPGVYRRGNYYRVLTRPDGKRKVMHRFDTYDEAVVFKRTTPSRGYRRGRLCPPRSLGDSPDYLRGDPCAYCGAPSEAVDHIVPRALGGADDASNWTAACTSCNSAKRDKPLLLFLARRNGCWEWRGA